MTHEKGHLLDQNQKSTVMACVYDSNRPVTTGVCNRISHFSNPDIDYTRPNCRACSEPTGTLDEDNMKIACLGAPGFSQLREPDADLTPHRSCVFPALWNDTSQRIHRHCLSDGD